MKHKKSKSKSKHQSSQSYLLKGNLDIARNGLGYVVIADGSGDVLVRPGNFNNALHGDTVRVKVFKENISTGKKEGKIAEVVLTATHRVYRHPAAIYQLCFFYS
jgi:ribonuclease R